MRSRLYSFTWKSILILLIGLHFVPANAQQIIKGCIWDAATHQKLSGCNIQDQTQKKKYVSDAEGNFSIELSPSGTSKVSFSYVGYNTYSIEITASTPFLNVELHPAYINIDPFFVTATRTPKKVNDLPIRAQVIDAKSIQNQAAMYPDELLQSIPGVILDRSQGIFSRNASITMRGLNSAQRVLILEDGVPLNKADGGSINWNRIMVDNIENIEVTKGPSSMIYGGSAMAGVVNIITAQPKKSLELMTKVYYGSYGTKGIDLIGGGNHVKEQKGFWWQVYGHYRAGDGYIMVAPYLRDSTDVPTKLMEYSGGAKLGYVFNSKTSLTVEYSFFDDKRNEGSRIYEEDGTYSKYTTHFCRANLSSDLGKVKLEGNLYFQSELFGRQTESMSVKNANKYTLYNTETIRNDFGVWLTGSGHLGKKGTLIGGMDFKSGGVDGKDIYKTSTDIVKNKGEIDLVGIFCDYEHELMGKKLILNAGLRFDYAHFHNGFFHIDEPGPTTEFMNNYPSDLPSDEWNALSPKLALKYNFDTTSSIYTSWNKGFRPPILDDICRNGNVTRGFKLANPYLQPEKIDNFEIGGTFHWHEFKIEPSIYYSLGKDFMYFAATGDSVYTGGDKLKAVLKRENIGTVSIVGTEISISYTISKHIRLSGNYSYSNSVITDYKIQSTSDVNLKGKHLTDVPSHQLFGAVQFNHPWINFSINASYRSFTWADDENTIQNQGYWQFNATLYKEFYKHITLRLNVIDVFDTPYINSKGQISPGRYTTFNVTYKL